MERTQLSAIVLDLLEKETGETYDALEDIYYSTTLNEGLGLDSLDMAGLILHIESHFGIQIETELLDKISNIGQILDTLEEKIAAKEGKNAA
jgi:acyl carrier protein